MNVSEIIAVARTVDPPDNDFEGGSYTKRRRNSLFVGRDLFDVRNVANVGQTGQISVQISRPHMSLSHGSASSVRVSTGLIYSI